MCHHRQMAVNEDPWRISISFAMHYRAKGAPTPRVSDAACQHAATHIQALPAATSVLERTQRDTLTIEKFNFIRRDIDFPSPAHPAFVFSRNDLSLYNRALGNDDLAGSQQPPHQPNNLLRHRFWRIENRRHASVSI